MRDDEFSEASKEIDKIIGDINELNFQLIERLVKSKANITIRCVECKESLTETEIEEAIKNKLKLDEIVCSDCFADLLMINPREVREL